MRSTQKNIKFTCKRHLSQYLSTYRRQNIFHQLVIVLVILARTPLARGASSQLSLDVRQTLGNGLDPLSKDAQYLDGLLDSILTASPNGRPESWGTQPSVEGGPGGPNFKGDPIELAGLHEGDILLPEPQLGLSQSVWENLNELSEVTSPGRGMLWPDGVLAYEFAEDFDYLPLERVLIEWTMKNIADKSCVKFVKRTSERNYVKIIYDSYKCYSSVGRVGGQQPLSLGMFCSLLWDRGNIYHELLHALGFYHEHTRPDRDEHVKVQWQNIKKGMEVNFKKDGRWGDDLLDMPYDLGSVMHYSSQAFSKMYFLYPTILSKEKGLFFMRPKEPSKLDYLKLNRLYKCPKNSRRRSRLLPKRREKEGRSLGGGGGGKNLFGGFGKLFRGLTSTLQPPPVSSHKTFLRPPPLPPIHQQAQQNFVAQPNPSIHTQGLQHNHQQQQLHQQINGKQHHEEKLPSRYDFNSIHSTFPIPQLQNYQHQPSVVGPENSLHNSFGTSPPTGLNAFLRQNPYPSATHYGSVNTEIVQGNSEHVQHMSNGFEQFPRYATLNQQENDLALHHQHASQPSHEEQRYQLHGVPLSNKGKRHISPQSYFNFNSANAQTNDKPTRIREIRGNGKFNNVQWTRQASGVSAQTPNFFTTRFPGIFRSLETNHTRRPVSNFHGNTLAPGYNFSSGGSPFMWPPSNQSTSHAPQQQHLTNTQNIHNNINTIPMTWVPQNDHYGPSNYRGHLPSSSFEPPQPQVYGMEPPALPLTSSAFGAKAFFHLTKDYPNLKFNRKFSPPSLTDNFYSPQNAIGGSNSFHASNSNGFSMRRLSGALSPHLLPPAAGYR